MSIRSLLISIVALTCLLAMCAYLVVLVGTLSYH